MEIKKMLLIYNPISGTELFVENLSAVIDVFTKSAFEVTVHPTQSSRDAYQTTIDRCLDFDYLVCAGGDGTLNEVVDALMLLPKHPILGYIPCGTTNDFATTLGLSFDIIEAANTICKGELKSIDVGKFNEEYFTYVAAFGVFTDASYTTPQSMKNILGQAAYKIEGIKSLFNIKQYQLTITCDDEIFSGDFTFGMVSNSISVGGFKFPFEIDTKLDDGKFEVVLVRKITQFNEIHQVIANLIDPTKSNDSIIVRSAKNITVKSNTPIDWTLDGEYRGDITSANIQILQNVIKIMVPIIEDSDLFLP